MRRLPATVGAWATAGLALVVAEQPWWRVAWADAAAFGWRDLSGTVATGGLAQALAFVALAGAAATLVLRRLGRRVVAVALAAALGGFALLGFLHPDPGPDAVRAALGPAALAEAWRVEATVWPWLAGIVGVAGVAAAVHLWLVPVAETSRNVRASAEQVADSLASWKAMDEGHDPTDHDPTDREQQ